MAAVVWTGHLAFGMVSIPISLYAAARPETTRFTRLQRRKRAGTDGTRSSATHVNGDLFSNAGGERGDLDAELKGDPATASSARVEYYRVRQVFQSAANGEEVPPHELLKVHEYGAWQYVVIDPAEYRKAAVETSDMIALFHFVKSNEVDPIYFERSYYAVPDVGGERAYALLLQAMQNQGCWAVARIGMHKREHVLILRTTEKGIIAHTMFYANEVRRAPKFHTDPGLVREQELTVAEALIKAYFGSFEPQKFPDIYQQRLQDLIQAGLRSTPGPAIRASRPNAAIVPDLMEELNQSLFQIQKKSAKPVDQKTTKGKSKDRNKVSYTQGKLDMTTRTTRVGFVEPMLLLPTSDLPEGAAWSYEPKLDGYRAIAFKTGGRVQLRSRNNKDFNRKYPAVAAALAALPNETVIDGEVVALDESGRPSFNLLQNYKSSDSSVFYYVFDVLVLSGQDVMPEPLANRRNFLRKHIFPTLKEPVRKCLPLNAALTDVIHAVCVQGLEGVVAKDLNSSYEPDRRSGAWRKMHINKGQKFVIGGYTPGPKTFDALIFGYYEGGKFLYAGRTRNGFTPMLREQLQKQFLTLEISECPFANLPEEKSGRWGLGLTAGKMKACRWLRPRLVGQFEYIEWTPDNHLRQSRFVALRNPDPLDITRHA